MTNLIEDYINSNITCLELIKSEYKEKIDEIFKLLLDAQENDKRIYLFGNGGSSSTASHFSSDLSKTTLTQNNKKIKAFCLSDNVPVILAWSNDLSFDDIFVKQLENHLEENDVVIGISGSGNSTNVLKAFEYAKEKNAKTISLTGKDGGQLAKNSDVSLIVPSQDMLTIETVHLFICHTLTSLFRSQGTPLFPY